MENSFKLGDKKFKSRLLTGSGKFASKNLIKEMLEASGSEIITIALRRIDLESQDDNILNFIPENITLLPNTSGARNAAEAIRIAHIARESGCGNFIKIEIINEMKYLLPDNEETIRATEILSKEGFIVLPYMMADLVSAKRLEYAGASAIMPLGSPIGTNRGLETKEFIQRIIDNTNLPVIVDAGIGKPSHAAEAMEMGASAVLINSAIATSSDPVRMGRAFSLAVEAGYLAFLSKNDKESEFAKATSPLKGFIRIGE